MTSVRRMHNLEATLGPFAKIKKFSRPDGFASIRVSCRLCGNMPGPNRPRAAHISTFDTAHEVADWWHEHEQTRLHGAALSDPRRYT